MSTPEPPADGPPELQDPDFIKVSKALHNRAERARAEKSKTLQEWSQEQTDEEILSEYGLDMNVLREDP
ncbi:hypothetical protein [Microlunatus sp. Gsoil 973]|uniref:hypothetical protein n=1 Tax=Microlunatus sp. Gsoil 973 TaxID=2672569 RepID=UPI0012B466C0|nr:hypothetical protein [Microlunatus sp. Gsoil 973]QGN34485.1 hypothetical protein GJV80_18550 [Microlunatus sp. Gsoil 973]